MKTNKIIASATLFALLQVLTIQAGEIEQSKISETLSAHIKTLNEVSAQRRNNTFFKNEQSIFHGLQKGYVNVGEGNLTFVRRDLVTVGRIPIVIARVYDSALSQAALSQKTALSQETALSQKTALSQEAAVDFGAGWQLSLAETIRINDDGSLNYRDDSGVTNHLHRATVGYKLNPAQNSDIQSVVFNNQGLIQIHYLTGWHKQFQQLGDVYRLVSITDNNTNQLNLIYSENRLSAVTAANNRYVNISRDAAGHISSVTDNNGRTVSYHYDNQAKDKKDQLNTVTDLAGQPWQYQYHHDNQLHKVIDPSGQLAATFSFNQYGKAASVKVRGQKYRYQYQQQKTMVKDDNGDSSTFTKNTQGITTAVTSADGFTSSIVLNPRNQITELWHNDQQQAQIVYDDNGLPSHYDINGKPSALETQKDDSFGQYHYQYDASGRVVTIDDSAGKMPIRYTYDDNGNLIKHRQKDINHHYQYSDHGDVLTQSIDGADQASESTTFSYNPDGLLSTLTQQQHTSQFDYTDAGKLNKVTFADGTNHQYSYNKLGFRTQTNHHQTGDGDTSNKSNIRYFYDKAGNLTRLAKTDGNNQTHSQTQHLNGHNQLVTVEATDKSPLEISYNHQGQPKRISNDQHGTNYHYDKLGRLNRINDSETGQSSYQYQPDEIDIRRQLDDRTRTITGHQSRISSHNQSQSALHYARLNGSPWQAVVWHEALSRFLVPSPQQLHVPNIADQSSQQRRRLYDVLANSKASQHRFDKVSNSFFRPPEYLYSGCELEEEPCYGILSYVLLHAPTGATVGQTLRFTAKAGVNRSCAPEYNFAFQNYYTTNTTGVFDVPLTSSGTSNAVVTATCCDSIKWFTMAVDVGPSDCNLSPVKLVAPNVVYATHATTFTAQIGENDCSSGTLSYQWFINGLKVSNAATKTFVHSFFPAGSYVIKVKVFCSCSSTPVEVQKTIVVVDPCDTQGIDQEAIAKLRSLPIKPYEFGSTFVCVNIPGAARSMDSIYSTFSFDSYQEQDPCKVGVVNTGGSTQGLGHSHPFFITLEEYHSGVGCKRDKSYRSKIFLDNLNISNKEYSIPDESAGFLSGKHYYLGTPLRDAIKVQRQDSFDQEEIWP
ncbi:MAG: YD repeat-containing protein [Phenylobacterium sp.]|jgi:YD repeat-containing protein